METSTSVTDPMNDLPDALATVAREMFSNGRKVERDRLEAMANGRAIVLHGLVTSLLARRIDPITRRAVPLTAEDREHLELLVDRMLNILTPEDLAQKREDAIGRVASGYWPTTGAVGKDFIEEFWFQLGVA